MRDRTAVSRYLPFLGSRPSHRGRPRSTRSFLGRARGSRSLRAETAHRLALAPVRLPPRPPSILIPAEQRPHAVRDAIDAVERLAGRETERVATQEDIAEGDRPFVPRGVDDLGLHPVVMRTERGRKRRVSTCEIQDLAGARS